jgi:hypothetical protein
VQYYGMMTEYHITEYGRQKILKDVAMKAQKLVVDKLWYVKSRSLIMYSSDQVF